MFGSKVVDLVRKRLKEELSHVSNETDEDSTSSEDTNHSRDMIKRASNKKGESLLMNFSYSMIISPLILFTALLIFGADTECQKICS